MPDNIKMTEAVQHYAETMGLSISDPQVVKYATGLSKKVEVVPHPEAITAPSRDRLSLRYVRAVRRYAESQGLDLGDEQVKKYARGLLNIFKEFRTRPEAIEELGLLADPNDVEAEADKVLETLK